MRATPTVVFSTLTALTALVAAPAAAQSYSVTSGSGSFSSIASIGTPLGLGGVDDGAASFNAPAPFPFFGQMVAPGTAIYVNTNGSVHIGSTYSDYQNTTLPSSGGPSNFAAVFWSDLRMGSTADAYWAVQGTELVIEWAGVESYTVSGETISFQARFALDGTIRFAYGPRVAGSGWAGATIGVEDATETLGAMAPCGASCTPSSVGNGAVLTFTPGASPLGPDLVVFGPSSPGTVNAGDTLTLPVVVENIGGAASGPTRVGLFFGLSSPVGPDDAELDSFSIGALPAGGIVEEVLTFTVPSGMGGAVAAGIIVDPSDVVSESNESNNVLDLGTVTIVDGGTGSVTITTREVPPGVVGIPYDVVLQTSGGGSPTFSIIEGALPPGLTLSPSTGRLSGTPTQEGEFFFGVQATAPELSPGQVFLEMIVSNGGSGGITVTPTTLADARVGVPYTGALSATGGAPPYAFQVISGRPDWLSVNGQGMLSGTPDAPGQHSLTVSVFDSELADSTAVVTLRVLESGPVSIVESLPAGVTGRAYAQPVIRGGIPPYQVSVLDGAFPDGFAVDDQGVLNGTAVAGGRWQVTLQVTDSNSPQGMAAGAVVLEVSELQPLEITIDNLQVPTYTDADIAIPVRGGIPPYQWSIVQGALPPGLTFDGQGGRIQGRIEEVTTSTITFRVQDSDGSTAEQPIVVVTKRQRSVDGGGGGRGSSRGGCVCLAPEPEAHVPLAAGILLLVAGARPWRRRGGVRRRRSGSMAPGRPGPS